MSPKRIIALSTVVAAGIIAYGGIRLAQRIAEVPVAGVSLGMSPEEVQGAFLPGVRGYFMVGSEDGEPSLTWAPYVRDPKSASAANFTFEMRRLARMELRFAPGVPQEKVLSMLDLAHREPEDGVVPLGPARGRLTADLAGQPTFVLHAPEGGDR